MNKIFLRFSANCADTGKKLKRGDLAYYDRINKKVYSIESRKAAEIIECINVGQYVQAQEDAYFDKFISLNYKQE